jgi:hypothetical protein
MRNTFRNYTEAVFGEHVVYCSMMSAARES